VVVVREFFLLYALLAIFALVIGVGMVGALLG
jgi:hypothetical protein